jgi:hypothetical protein
MKFHLNEKVAFLNESGFASIKSISNSNILIEDEFGFERYVLSSQLVKIMIDDYDIPTSAKYFDKDNIAPKKIKKHSNKKRVKETVNSDVWEIDLHLENLPQDILKSPDTHYIDMQMKALRYFLERVKKNRVKKFIVIHGVGDGILKDQVISYLSRFESYKLQDGDSSKYGKGATQVIVSFEY